MNKQEEFLQKIIELKEIARLQGHCISSEQAGAFVEENQLSKEQADFFYQYLSENKIGIDTPPEVELDGEDRNYLDLYLEEMKELPSLSEAEQKALTIQALAGEADAGNQLILAYLPYVVDLAKLYTGQGVYIEDLIGEGNVALSAAMTLIGALEDPEEVQGYLGKKIMEAMEAIIDEAVAEKKTEEKTVNKVNKVADKVMELSDELRRAVTLAELMEETGFSEKEIRDAVRISGGKIENLEI